MAEYNNLAELRQELTADDPDQRANAYAAVLNADLEVSDVLGPEPPTQALEDAGVVPENTTENRKPAAEHRVEQTELLKEIRDILKSQGGA